MHGYYSNLAFYRVLWSEGNLCERVGNYQFLNAFFSPKWDSRVTDSEPLCRLLLCVSFKNLQQELNLEY